MQRVVKRWFWAVIGLSMTTLYAQTIAIDQEDGSNWRCPGEKIAPLEGIAKSVNVDTTGSMHAGWDSDKYYFTAEDSGVVKLHLKSAEAMTYKAGNECNTQTFFRAGDRKEDRQEFRVAKGEKVAITLFDWESGAGYDYDLGIEFVADHAPAPQPEPNPAPQPKPNPTPTPTIVGVVNSQEEASAFLSRATFGSTSEEIEALLTLGNYEKWIDQQLTISPTYHMAWIEQHLKGINGTPDLKSSLENWKRHSDTLSYVQRDAWWHIATYAPDQLRQRVAFALSEILVISKNGPLLTSPDARISYYDVLLKNAFGNFEDLLKDVTYHPAMGKYLSYLGNPKADVQAGSHPDENYARELMQLFSIGLYKLNLDGTQKLQNDKPVPTYSQKDIKEMARVFTGLSDDNGQFAAEAAYSSHHCRTSPMVSVENMHDHGSKTVLGHTINTGSTKGDINAALHILFMHENTAPFISKQLIQRLVTSNPTPAYVARVATVFNDNGKGVRGDLGAVVKAILLDKEALRKESHPDNFGKFREPLLYFTHLFRAFHAKGNPTQQIHLNNGPTYQYESFHFNGTGMTRQEGALEALTVFNYFTPIDGPYSVTKQGLVAPELMLYGKRGIDDVLMGIINKNDFIYSTYELTIDLDLDKEIASAQANDLAGLLEHLNLLLTANNMSEQSKNSIIRYLKNAKDDNGNRLNAETVARYAIALVMTSPAYALQR